MRSHCPAGWCGTSVGGSIAPIVQDAAPYFVDGHTWPAHNVNMVQFFSITDEGLMLPENSFGCAFSQHLHIMDHQEIQDFCLQHFNRLVQQAGAAGAHKDAQAALMHRQQQMAQWPPVQLQFSSSSSGQHMPLQAPVPPAGEAKPAQTAANGTVPPSFPAAGDPTVLQPGASAATSSSAIQWQQKLFHQYQQQDAAGAEDWKKFYAARAQLQERSF